MIDVSNCQRFPNKMAFENKDEALSFAFRSTFAPHPPKDTGVLYVYQCPSCHLVHLTKVFQGSGCEMVYGLGAIGGRG